MPANAAVTLDLRANTADASRGVETLRRQLKTIQVQASASASAWSNLRTPQRFRVGSGVAMASLDLATAFLPSSASEGKLGKTLTGAAQGAQRLGMMLASLGPTGIAAGAAIGGFTSGLKAFVNASKEAARALVAESAAARKRGTRHNDYIGEEAWAWQNADAAGRGKLQAEARERIRKAQWKLENGMSISESDVYGVANWDKTLALRLGAADGSGAGQGERLDENLPGRSAAVAVGNRLRQVVGAEVFPFGKRTACFSKQCRSVFPRLRPQMSDTAVARIGCLIFLNHGVENQVQVALYSIVVRVLSDIRLTRGVRLYVSGAPT